MVVSRLYRPQTLSETLHLLREHGDQVHPEYPQAVACSVAPAGATPLGIDTSRLSERNGIHQFGGRLLIGLNMTLAELARSSLVRSQATCLQEACAYLPLVADKPLALAFAGLPASLNAPPPDFWPPLVALLALDAEVELAWLGASERVEQILVPLAELSSETFPQPVLPLAVSFPVTDSMGGSAFVPVPATPGMAPTPLAAAVRLAFAADAQTVASARIALVSPAGAPARVPSAEDCLQGRPLDPESIGAAAQGAQHFALAQWPATSTARSYPIQLAAHLVRTALDRAAARARDTASDATPF